MSGFEDAFEDNFGDADIVTVIDEEIEEDV